MTARLPLVLGANGLPQQLQSGDSLNVSVAAAWSGVPFIMSNGATFTVPQGQQGLYQGIINTNGGILISQGGILKQAAS